MLAVIAGGLQAIQARILLLDREIAIRAKANSVAKRLMTIPGIGPVVAIALMALAPAASTFRRGRDFAAWLGLTQAALQRGHGAAGPDNQDGRAKPAKAADSRSELGHKSRRADVDRYGVSQCHGGFEVEAGENPSSLAAKTLTSRITKPDIRQQL